MYGRIARVAVRNGASSKLVTIDGLDVRFNIRKNCYFINDAKISILNPSRSVIKRYLSNISSLKDAAEKRPITLSVGWEDEGDAQPIFNGMVESAIPTIPPDVWLNMQCTSSFYDEEREVAVSIGSVDTASITIRDVLKKCEERFNDGIKDESTKYKLLIGAGPAFEKQVRSFTKQGKIRSVLMALAALNKDLVFINEGFRELKIVDRTTVRSNIVHEIDEGYGIIGMPRVNWPTVFVEIMMNPSIDVYQDVHLSVPSLDGEGQTVSGDYRILSVNYNGQLRSGGFSMTLELVPVAKEKESREKPSKK